jgi:hypothetical protein
VAATLGARCGGRHGDGAAGPGGPERPGAINALRRDLAGKVARGLRPDEEGCHPTVLVSWPNRIRGSPRPRRIGRRQLELAPTTMTGQASPTAPGTTPRPPRRWCRPVQDALAPLAADPDHGWRPSRPRRSRCRPGPGQDLEPGQRPGPDRSPARSPPPGPSPPSTPGPPWRHDQPQRRDGSKAPAAEPATGLLTPGRLPAATPGPTGLELPAGRHPGWRSWATAAMALADPRGPGRCHLQAIKRSRCTARPRTGAPSTTSASTSRRAWCGARRAPPRRSPAPARPAWRASVAPARGVGAAHRQGGRRIHLQPHRDQLRTAAAKR